MPIVQAVEVAFVQIRLELATIEKVSAAGVGKVDLEQ
jgi:hypothetical protein